MKNILVTAFGNKERKNKMDLMDRVIDFLILLFSILVGLVVIFLLQPHGKILTVIVLFGTISIVYLTLIWLYYNTMDGK